MSRSLYTRRGDAGETSLGDGSRTRKDAARVEAYGTIDEAASAVGLARAAVTDTPLDLLLAFLQQRLLTVAGALSDPKRGDAGVDDRDVAALERASDDLAAAAGGFRGFVLPGGGEAAARLEVARSVVRRAERRAVTLASTGAVDPAAVRFLNRASDALFAAARYANVLDGVDEQAWDAGFTPPEGFPGS